MWEEDITKPWRGRPIPSLKAFLGCVFFSEPQGKGEKKHVRACHMVMHSLRQKLMQRMNDSLLERKLTRDCVKCQAILQGRWSPAPQPLTADGKVLITGITRETRCQGNAFLGNLYLVMLAPHISPGKADSPYAHLFGIELSQLLLSQAICTMEKSINITYQRAGSCNKYPWEASQEVSKMANGRSLGKGCKIWICRAITFEGREFGTQIATVPQALLL